MALPSAPSSISMSQVNTELSRSATATINLNDAEVRTLAGVPSGAISMDNLRGKSAVSLAFNNAQGFAVQSQSDSIAVATIVLQPNGGISYEVGSGSASISGPTAYLSPLQTNAGAQYEARLSTYSVTINSSGYATALNVDIFSNVVGASTSYVALSEQRIIRAFPNQGDEVSISFTLEIRKIGTASPVISRSGSAHAFY